jgi:Protein of unknown function (DUF1501)
MLDLPRLFAPPPLAYRSRREFLACAGGGFGLLALADLLRAGEAPPATNAAGSPSNPLAPRPAHFAGKAKAVIWLFMNGGPSHVDTWDRKPELDKRDGLELPNFDPNTGFFNAQVGPLMKSPFKWSQHGQCGKWVSELFPNMAKHVDKMAFIHSLWSDSNNHSPALFKMNTGMSRMGNPCVGSWVTYGLGTESQSLPAFCVMYDTLGRGIPKGHSLNWGAGFLPTVFQGTAFKPQGEPIDNLSRPADLSADRQRAQLDLLKKLDKPQLEANPGDAELAARVETFELAYRMQMAAPDALDLAKETDETKKLYGLDNPKATHFAKQCLTARRLVERGVRFVQIYSGGMDNDLSWDGHNNIVKNHGGFALETDQPIAGLLTDLERKGLLKDTLVIWGGEFGRLPIVQKGSGGRDHNPHANTFWLAGGGVKGGVSYGATDDIGFKAAENRVSVHDLHATILHLLGLDHTKLTFRFQGRDFRLTDVAGNVVTKLLV